MKPEEAKKVIEGIRNGPDASKVLREANKLAKEKDIDIDVDIDQSLLWRLQQPCQFYASASRRSGRISRWFFQIMEICYGYKFIIYLVYLAIMVVILGHFEIW